MSHYIHQLPQWPDFSSGAISPTLARVRHHQGRLIGRIEAVGFQLRQEAELETLPHSERRQDERDRRRKPQRAADLVLGCATTWVGLHIKWRSATVGAVYDRPFYSLRFEFLSLHNKTGGHRPPLQFGTIASACRRPQHELFAEAGFTSHQLRNQVARKVFTKRAAALER